MPTTDVTEPPHPHSLSYGSGSAQIHIFWGRRIRIRIKIKSWIRIRIQNSKALEAHNRAVEGHGGLEAKKGVLGIYRLVVAETHHFEELLDPDPHLSEKMDPDPHLCDADPQPCSQMYRNNLSLV
jgi:hypothetical protein